MQTLRKSPFKVGSIEDDPHAYGLRIETIVKCIQALYDNRNLLISGERGIGKSSLGRQLQYVMEGQKTLLNRCGIKADFSKTLCAYHACDQSTSLHQLVEDILYKVEKAIKHEFLITGESIFSEVEISLGIFRGKFNDKYSKIHNMPGTIATEFVKGIYETMQILRAKKFDYNINIMIDEIDQLSKVINFGHFIKVIHEEFGREDLKEVTFIFAGQSGIYKRFTEEDPSFERIVLHVPIATLNNTASQHILEFAKTRYEPAFEIEFDCEQMIIALAAGYPYYIHLLGNEAFYAMNEINIMGMSDLLRGLESLLRSGKFEKYMEILKKLTREEQTLIIGLCEYSLKSVPARIPIAWIEDKFGKGCAIETDTGMVTIKTEHILTSLVGKGYLKRQENLIHKTTYYSFNDELFRVFIALRQIIRHEIYLKQLNEEQNNERLKYEKASKYEIAKEERLFRMIKSGELDRMLKETTADELDTFVAKLQVSLNEADYRVYDTEDDWSIE